MIPLGKSSVPLGRGAIKIGVLYGIPFGESARPKMLYTRCTDPSPRTLR
jgi:hypothetical protein